MYLIVSSLHSQPTDKLSGIVQSGGALARPTIRQLGQPLLPRALAMQHISSHLLNVNIETELLVVIVLY